MQIRDAIIPGMPVIPASRLIIGKTRIVVDSIVRPPLLSGFALGLRGAFLGVQGTRILRVANEWPSGGEREGDQKQRWSSSSHVSLR